MYNELDLGQRSCDCSTQCNETDFNVIPSLALFPSDKYEATLQEDFNFTQPSGNTSMTDNLLRVDIYFATLNVQTITETPVFSSVSLSRLVVSK